MVIYVSIKMIWETTVFLKYYLNLINLFYII